MNRLRAKLPGLYAPIGRQKMIGCFTSRLLGGNGGARSLASSSATNDDKVVRIGCASGFWGDTAVSSSQLIHGGKLDFLVFDYLSEITMSLLTAAKQKQPDMGYAPDFVQAAIGPNLKAIKQKGIRVVSNAGGVNPVACAGAIRAAASKAGVDLSVAVVTGDDILAIKDDLIKKGAQDMFSGKPFPSTVNSMTAYLGAAGIERALSLGADVVVTGRCTDSALALGPLIHSFKWPYSDYDLMAAGSLAGHLIECGAQSTGGIFTDWHRVNGWDNIGFPIVECHSSGEFVLTKPPNTGGLVSPGTVSEQLVYEIGDPSRYELPDVICDFTQVQIEQVKDREGEAVRVWGARGLPPSNAYKVSTTYADGYRLTAVFVVMGTRAADKGRKTAEAIVSRVRRILKVLGLADFTKVHVQVIGAEDSYGQNANPDNKPRECTVWIAAHHAEKRALEILSREIAPAGTGMAPGLCGIVGGRPKVSPVLKLFSFLHPKDQIQISVGIDDRPPIVVNSTAPDKHTNSSRPRPTNVPPPPAPRGSSESGEGAIQGGGVATETGSHSFRLEDLAFTRSGDKGNTCNIGVIARHPSFTPYLRHQLSAAAVRKYMAHVFETTPSSEGHSSAAQDDVIRYELPGINGFNFVLRNALGGGGISSLRVDPQGKAFGQMLLDFKIENVPDLLAVLKSTKS